MFRYLAFLMLFSFSTELLAMSCSDVLGHSDTTPINDVQLILDQFEFPADAEVPISDPHLRKAIYEAFGGKDIYTGEAITFEEMRIDHFVPSSKGGPDNIFNYPNQRIR